MTQRQVQKQQDNTRQLGLISSLGMSVTILAKGLSPLHVTSPIVILFDDE